jgi:hypothetical protein
VTISCPLSVLLDAATYTMTYAKRLVAAIAA